jgi:hypothetical protein
MYRFGSSSGARSIGNDRAMTHVLSPLGDDEGGTLFEVSWATLRRF